MVDVELDKPIFFEKGDEFSDLFCEIAEDQKELIVAH